MTKNASNATGMQATVKKAGRFARISDLVLCVAFLVAAFYVGRDAGGWFWALLAMSAFCLLTAVTSPVERMLNAIQGKMLGVKRS